MPYTSEERRKYNIEYYKLHPEKYQRKSKHSRKDSNLMIHVGSLIRSMDKAKMSLYVVPNMTDEEINAALENVGPRRIALLRQIADDLI